MYRAYSPAVLAGAVSSQFRKCISVRRRTKNERGSPGTALFQTGWKYDQGVEAPANMPEAMRLYRQAIEQGNSLAKAP